MNNVAKSYKNGVEWGGMDAIKGSSLPGEETSLKPIREFLFSQQEKYLRREIGKYEKSEDGTLVEKYCAFHQLTYRVF